MGRSMTSQSRPIVTRLTEAYKVWKSISGTTARAIFLGHTEHDELIAVAEQFFGGSGGLSPIDDEAVRLEWHQMKVYRVDARSFIGFETLLNG